MNYLNSVNIKDKNYLSLLANYERPLSAEDATIIGAIPEESRRLFSELLSGGDCILGGEIKKISTTNYSITNLTVMISGRIVFIDNITISGSFPLAGENLYLYWWVEDVTELSTVYKHGKTPNVAINSSNNFNVNMNITIMENDVVLNSRVDGYSTTAYRSQLRYTLGMGNINFNGMNRILIATLSSSDVTYRLDFLGLRYLVPISRRLISGDGIDISNQGLLNTDLTISGKKATNRTLGSIIVGNSLRVDSNGVLDTYTIDWSGVLNKPEKYEPLEHNHDTLYYRKLAIDNFLSLKANTTGRYSGLNVGSSDKLNIFDSGTPLLAPSGNSNIESGLYFGESGNGYPISGSNVIRVGNNGSNEILLVWSNPTTPKMLIRSKMPNGSWTPWVELLSTFNTDLSLYVLKAGDTMTGNLILPEGVISQHAINKGQLDSHAILNTHITSAERSYWNNMTPMTTFNTHKDNLEIHVTSMDKTYWNNMTPMQTFQSHVNSVVHITSDERAKWNNMTPMPMFDEHKKDTNIHVTSQEKSNWNAKVNRSGDTMTGNLQVPSLLATSSLVLNGVTITAVK